MRVLALSVLYLFYWPPFFSGSSVYRKYYRTSLYDDEEFLRTIGQFWTVSFSLRTKVSQMLQSVLCITTDKYLVRVLAVLLHARFSVVSPIPFLLAAIFLGSSLYRKYYFPIHTDVVHEIGCQL